MRTTLILLLGMLLFSACTTYQYVRIDSNQLQKDKKDLFTMENDTMRLVYSFSGAGGNVTVSVFNKTSQPFYIDWSRSSIIRNDQSFTLQRRDAELIPPQTSISDIVLNLNEQGGGIPKMTIPDTAHTRFLQSQSGTYERYHEVDFSESASPIRLKSYLTFLMGTPAETTDRVLTHTFYVGAAMHTGVYPSAFGRYHDPGATLYVWFQ
jgi:hypothetical protein